MDAAGGELSLLAVDELATFLRLAYSQATGASPSSHPPKRRLIDGGGGMGGERVGNNAGAAATAAAAPAPERGGAKERAGAGCVNGVIWFHGEAGAADCEAEEVAANTGHDDEAVAVSEEGFLAECARATAALAAWVKATAGGAAGAAMVEAGRRRLQQPQQQQQQQQPGHHELSGSGTAACAGDGGGGGSWGVEGEVNFQGRVVELTRAIKLGRSECLVIRGGTIRGHCHSLFSMQTDRSPGGCGGLAALTLIGCVLEHTMESPDVRAIGACVFAMGRAVVSLEACTLSSARGFGVWAKHRARVQLRGCVVAAGGAGAVRGAGAARGAGADEVGAESMCGKWQWMRTGLACFNAAAVSATDTTIADCEIHGVCLRGESRVELTRCRVASCGDRGCYAYQHAALTLENCTVTGTRNKHHCAIEADGGGGEGGGEGGEGVDGQGGSGGTKRWGSSSSSSCRLTMRGCSVFGNAGGALRVTGAVAVDLHDNHLEEQQEVFPSTKAPQTTAHPGFTLS